MLAFSFAAEITKWMCHPARKEQGRDTLPSKAWRKSLWGDQGHLKCARCQQLLPATVLSLSNRVKWAQLPPWPTGAGGIFGTELLLVCSLQPENCGC